MKNRFLFWLCQLQAKWITWRMRRRYGNVKAYNIKFSVGGGSSSGSTAFSRSGTEAKTSNLTLPTELVSLIDSAAQQLSLSNSDLHSTLLTNLLAQDPSAYPGSNTLSNVMAQTPSSMPWYSNLLSMAQQDPYSSAYETNTQEAYLNRLNETLAGLDSATVRTGTNHQGLVKGQAVADATRERSADLARQRGVDSGVALNAGQILNSLQQFIGAQQIGAAGQAANNNNMRVAQSLQAGGQRSERGGASIMALGQSAKTRGTVNESISSNMTGQGTQSSSNFTWGSGGDINPCCWIVSTSYNGYPGGHLPEFVRQGRDDFQTPEGIRGYRKMSEFLVPRMMRSRIWMWVTNTFMVRPITFYGAFRYNAKNHPGHRWGWLCKPVLHVWLSIWKGMGK